MISDFLSPIEQTVLDALEDKAPNCLGKLLRLHTAAHGLPDLDGVKMVIIGVQEGRHAVNNTDTGQDIAAIRQKLYALYPGNWSEVLADLGTIKQGATVADTYFAVQQTLTFLLKKAIIPILIGGGQDVTYANYKAYTSLEQTVNITSVDSRFNFGSLEAPLNSETYLSKLIMEQPSHLFNFCNIGYQTYFNTQEEIELIASLNFDAYRLGKAKDLELIEPTLRDADIVSIDIGAVKQTDAPANANASPNGFNGEEICAISRYAGLSDKVSSFGVYEYNAQLDNNQQTAHLIAQMIWYFIEGVNFRVHDYPFSRKENYQKYNVLLEDDDMLTFYKSNKSGRWWIEINIISNNKYKRHALIPCTYKEYTEATQQMIPEKWYKALNKMV